jgi:hypothetical protein
MEGTTPTKDGYPMLTKYPKSELARRRGPILIVLGLLAALFSAAPAQAIAPQGTLDANNLAAAQLTSYQGFLSSNAPYAQTFTATRSGKLTSAQVTLFLFTPGAPPTDPISLEVTDLDVAGNPVEPALATTNIPASDVTAVQPTPGVPPNPASLVTGTFSAPANVVAGHQYALVLRTTSTLAYAVSFADGASYPDGIQLLGSQFATGGWFQYSVFDMIFATYITPDVTSFKTFSPIVSIDRDGRKIARLRAGAAFSLGAGSDGLNPVKEAVTFSLNGYSLTVPAGAVRDLGRGSYAYVGTINGAQIALGLTAEGPGKYLIGIQVLDNGLRTLANPLDVTLTIGNDSGATQIRGKFS